MNQLIITNALIVTCDKNHTIINQGSAIINNGIIDKIYETDSNNDFPAEAKKIIDANGKILMPGLINMHCHAADSLFRGLVENLALEEWLAKVWIAEKAILTPKTTYTGSILGLAENLMNGVTTVMDMFWYPEETASAAKKIGMRLATGGIFFDPPGVGGRTQKQYLTEAENFFEKYWNDDFIIPCSMPHATYTVGETHLKEAKILAEKYNGLFSTHAAETIAEQNDIKNRYGRSVIKHLSDLGLLGSSTSLAHCVHLNKTEIELIAESSTSIIHNPISNLKLGSGIAPVWECMDAGINMTLGTDGAISGNDLDLWMALRLAATLPKGFHMKPDIVNPKEALHMVTLNGAKALGLDMALGSIEKGKKADLILIDINKIHSVPIFDPITHLVYSTARSDITDVFVQGKQVMGNKQIKNINISDTLEEVKLMSQKIASTLDGENYG